MPTITAQHDPTLFLPNPGAQSRFMHDQTHRYCALAGGWFAGKTWAGARKLVHLHFKNAFDDRGHPTFVKSAVIAPTYQLACDFDIPEIRRALDEMRIRHTFINDPKRFCFILPGFGTPRRPSQILIRTADRPDHITGWTVGALWGDEAARWKYDPFNPQSDPFIQADARLRDTRARFLQFILTFTHEGDDTRMYRDFEQDPKPHHILYRAPTTENPHALSFAATQRHQLSQDLASQYLQGLATSTAGQRMYSSFDATKNVDDSLQLRTDLPLQLAVDFNIEPGMHAILGQHHKDLLTALHELHEPRMSVKRLAISLRTLLDEQFGGWPYPPHMPLQIFGDASGSAHWAGVGQSCFDILCESLRHHGIPHQLRIPRTNPHVADRVNALNCALQDVAGTVRYLIHPRCHRLIDDLRTMRWAATGEADKSNRHLSHSSDAEGYRVHYLMPIRRIHHLPGQIGVFRS